MSLTSNYDKNRKGTCHYCVKAVKWVPVLFIVLIILWSYYGYAVQLCFFTIQNMAQRILYLLMYHFVFILFAWSYWQTIFSDIGLVPAKYRMPRNTLQRLASAESEEQQRRVLEEFAKDLPVVNRTMAGAIRYCDKCQHVKPDRAHHCRVCGVCVLKLDHHCPWVNNCISYTNYKYFILFLGYGLLYCLYVAATSLEFFVLYWKGELEGMGRFHVLFLFFVSLMFAISLVSLFGYHVYLVLLNRTTIEGFYAPIFRTTGPDKNGFSLGKLANFQEVFGDDKKLWVVPIFTSLGDGLQFPTQSVHQLSSYESMGDTSTSMGDGVTYPTRCMAEDTESLLGADERSNQNPDFETDTFDGNFFIDSRH